VNQRKAVGLISPPIQERMRIIMELCYERRGKCRTPKCCRMNKRPPRKFTRTYVTTMGVCVCVCVYACGVFHPVSVRVNVSHVAAHLSLQSACAYNTSVVLSKIRKPMHRILVTDNMLLHNRHGLHFPSSGLFSDSFLLRRHKVNAFHSFNFTKCFY